MRRRTATLGVALLLGTAAFGAAATPTSAQPHLDCVDPLSIPCAVVNRALANMPGTVEMVRSVVLPVYDEVTGAVRCVISGDCP